MNIKKRHVFSVWYAVFCVSMRSLVLIMSSAPIITCDSLICQFQVCQSPTVIMELSVSPFCISRCFCFVFQNQVQKGLLQLLLNYIFYQYNKSLFFYFSDFTWNTRTFFCQIHLFPFFYFQPLSLINFQFSRQLEGEKQEVIYPISLIPIVPLKFFVV